MRLLVIVVACLIGIVLCEILSTLQDIRVIESESRDAVNCIAWPDDRVCLPFYQQTGASEALQV